MGVSKVLK